MQHIAEVWMNPALIRQLNLSPPNIPSEKIQFVSIKRRSNLESRDGATAL